MTTTTEQNTRLPETLTQDLTLCIDIIIDIVDTVVDIMFDIIKVEMGVVGGEAGRVPLGSDPSTLCHVGLLKTLSRQHIIRLLPVTCHPVTYHPPVTCHPVTCLACFPPPKGMPPDTKTRFLVAVGILEVYHQLQLPPFFPC